jgi:NADH-quinone oxidoreductase subunit L
MLQSLLIVAFPLASFVLLLLFGHKLGKTMRAIVASLGVLCSSLCALSMLASSSHETSQSIDFYTWISSFGQFEAITFAFHIDALSLVMICVVSFVSFWIIIYSLEYMADEEGYCRFFATVNLFVAFMLVLVLANNLLLLFLAWEGVGLCSFLLIGFYYSKKEAQAAATKAFITTRIGDVFLLLAVIISYYLFNTLDIAIINQKAALIAGAHQYALVLPALCFIIGAIGKSAQLPLYTWLADAMWGPTPVSALIHAATMVTAGVYLIARLSGLFLTVEIAQNIILIVGALTLLFGGLLACLQSDLKKVLAYSTMSQLGYMFLALGAAAYNAAIFHLLTHAFFKALLFLTAGIIGHAVHSYDMKVMGALKEKNILVFIFFLIGILNLIGFPLISAGFFSKEWILSQSLHTPYGLYAFLAGVLGAALTGFYSLRMLIKVFFGSNKSAQKIHCGFSIFSSLIVLAFFSLTIGWLESPAVFGHINIMAEWLSPTLPLKELSEDSLLILFMPSLASLSGAFLAMAIYGFDKKASERSYALVIKKALDFDALYNFLLVMPYLWLSRFLKKDFLTRSEDAVASFSQHIFASVQGLQEKKLKHYLSFMILAALVMASTMVIK